MQHITIQSPPPLRTEKALSEQEEIVHLGDSLVMDTYILNYDEFQKNIVQARKKHFLDDLTSPTYIRERVIVMDTRRNPKGIVATNLAFTSDTK